MSIFNAQRDIFVKLRQRAGQNPKRIVLPEGNESRVAKAIDRVVREKIARLLVFGSDNLHKIFADIADPDYLEIIDVDKNDIIDKYAAFYFALRKHKGINLDTAIKIVRENPVYIAALMTREGLADGFVAGASLTTRDVARAAIHCIGKKEDVSSVFGVFIMVVPGSIYGHNGLFVFADCAILPQPDVNQLADIAVLTADFTRSTLGITPRVAMLSYSTKGSSSGNNIDVVIQATEMVKNRYPDLFIDGELQVDAAIIPEVAGIKAPQSKVAGLANILVFPNLEAANCSYKLVHRLAGAGAVGPVLLGLTKPASDLSRGCSVEDVVDAVTITAVRAQE
jgi:phosphate acetyltransferase